MHEKHGKKEGKILLVDAEFEQAVNEYIDLAIERERADYRSDIPFEAYAASLRTKLRSGLHQFQQSYTRGFKLLLAEIEKLHPGDDLSLYQAKLENLDLLSNPTALADFLSGSKPIYQILGFTDDAMVTFFEVGSYLLEERRYQDAVNVFYFLVTISPNFADFWLELGFAYAQLEEFQNAIKAYSRAIDLAPESYDAYLACASVLVRTQDFEQAQKTCDVGLQYAHAHSGEEWAEELVTMLEEAKKQIETAFNKSKYGTFSS